MKRGHTASAQRSCGSYFQSIHGLRKTPTGNSWSAMMSRCFNKNYSVYQQYGAVGITVCEFIRKSPASILDLIGMRPVNKTIDRKDNLGNYSCGSCAQCVSMGWPMNIRWATNSEQGRNRKTNQIFEFAGVSRCVAEWSESTGVRSDLIYNRISRGVQSEKVLSPVKEAIKFEINGQSKTLREWSDATGVKVKTLQRRLHFGISGEDLIKPTNHAYIRANYRSKRTTA